MSIKLSIKKVDLGMVMCCNAFAKGDGWSDSL